MQFDVFFYKKNDIPYVLYSLVTGHVNLVRCVFFIFILFLFLLCFIKKSFAGSNLEQTGDILQLAVPVTAAAISVGHDDFEGLGQVAEGALWTAASTHLLKAVIDEKRPNGQDHNSFPSGHTSCAAQGAAYLQFRYGWKYGVPAYMATGIVGYSRVESDHHYWRDVVAGAALASGIQYAITGMGVSVTNFVIVPTISAESVGVYASVNF